MIEVFETRSKGGYCGFACLVHVAEMFFLNEKGVVRGNDRTEELMKTFLKGFVCLVDLFGNVVPCDFDGT